jgi:hypothetical protein
MIPDAVWLEGLEPVVGVQVGSVQHLCHGTGLNQLHRNRAFTSTTAQAAVYCGSKQGLLLRPQVDVSIM